jgi:hypothetical protein
MDAGAAPPSEYPLMFGFLRKRAGRAGAQRSLIRRVALRLEQLEDRSLMSGLTAPALSSNPGAPATLWLDFTGLPTMAWGAYSNVATPAFNLDADPSSFSAQEISVISEVWQRVAEIYSPFNLNVTTVQPPDTSHGHTMIVAIGGSYNDWYHQPAGGVTYTGSFANPYEPNISHVFVDGTGGVAKYIAVAAAHEAGHGFGLDHQSVLDSSGNLVQEYNPGTSAEAPIMGYAYNAARAVWWAGTTDTGAIQNDETVIAGATNGFGYRPDFYGQSLATATQVPAQNGVAEVGVIDAPSSADYFTFSTRGGAASFAVGTAAVGPTLHARLELWSASGLIAVSDSATTLGASISTTLAAGRYYLVVRSHGNFGDVGQYSLTVNAPSSGVGSGSGSGGAQGGIAPPLSFVLRPDGSLWVENLSLQQWGVASPPGTILSVGASRGAAGDEAFALASDHSLWVYSAAGWAELSPAGTISALSASPNDVVFAVASDQSLWGHSAAGWSLLSPAGTILSAAAGADAAGGAEVFAVAADHSLWQFDQGAWRILSPAGTILSVAAVGDSAFAAAADGSVWRHTAAGWTDLFGPPSPASESAGTDAAGNPALYALGVDHSLWRFTAAQGWQLLSPAGSVQSLADDQGADLFVTAADAHVWKFDGFGWNMVLF